MWKCSKCKREFKNKNQSHSCVNYPLENHFKGKEKIAVPLFKKLVAKLKAKHRKLKIESLPCCIHFVGNYTFGAAWLLKDRIRVDFRLAKPIKDPRVFQEVKMSANRFLYYVDIKKASEIDAKLLSWLNQAYNLNK